MFRDVPGCSGMFRDVPCSWFYRRPDLNVKLRGFQEVFIRTQKLNSDLFNYSCVH